MGFLKNTFEKRSFENRTWNEFLEDTKIEEVDRLKDSTYITCVSFIADNISKLRLEVLEKTARGEKLPTEHKWNFALNIRSNNCMTPTEAIRTLITLGEVDGISALYIDKKRKQLIPVKINSMIVDNVGLVDSAKNNPIMYTISSFGAVKECLDRDLVIYKGSGLTLDGAHNKSVSSLLGSTIGSLTKGNNYVLKSYEKGLTGKIVLQLTSDIKDRTELAKIQNKFATLYNAESKILALPAGYQMQNLATTLKDSDFSEIRKLSKREICSAFHLPSSIIGDYEGINGSNSEQIHLQIYADCLQPKLKGLQEELSYKLLTAEELNKFCIEFDESDIYKLDMKTRVDILTGLKDKSILTTDDIRIDLGYKALDSKYSAELTYTSGYLPESVAEKYYTAQYVKVTGETEDNPEENDMKGGEDSGNKEN